METTTYDCSLSEIKDENVTLSSYKQKVLLAVDKRIIDNRCKYGLTVAARASYEMSSMVDPITDIMMQKYLYLLAHANVNAQTCPTVLSHFFMGVRFQIHRKIDDEHALIRVIRLICDKMTPAYSTPVHDALREREREDASYCWRRDYEEYLNALLYDYPLVHGEVMRRLRFESGEEEVGDREVETLQERVDELEETVALLKKTIEGMKT